MTERRAGLVVASNRLPFVLARAPDGRLEVTPGSGGLVTALLPVLRDRGGIWVGWPGLTEAIDNLPPPFLDAAADEAGYHLEPVLLTEEERQKFYHGFANEIIWPLFHDLQSLCHFDPSYWHAYLARSTASTPRRSPA